MLRGRLGFFVVAAALFLVFLFLRLDSASLGLPLYWRPFRPSVHEQTYTTLADATQDADILKELNLSPKIEFQRHCFVAKQKSGVSRESLVDVSSSSLLTATFTTIDRDVSSDLPQCGEQLNLSVPPFASESHVDTSELMLGVATTLQRIEKSLPAFQRWLSHTRSTLLVLLVDQPDLAAVAETVQSVQHQAEEAGMILIFEPFTGPSKSEGVRNFALAEALHRRQLPGTKWFGVIDDDTFFVSLRRMVDVLRAYDPEREWYIGALTEGLFRIAKEGFKAWGGAGFFISPPLMETLAASSAHCQELDQGFGDLLWRDCILEVTSPTVHLTEIPGLNQIDLWSDISGWYEAGHNPLLTVHHWKSWHFHPVPIAHLVADVAGPDTFLQRYKFADNIIMTNGFSVVQYPHGLPDLNRVELTMVEDVGIERPPGRLEFHHSLGSTRPALAVGTDKISWRFEQAIVSDDGHCVRQFYVKRASQGGNGNSDSVIEVDWIRSA